MLFELLTGRGLSDNSAKGGDRRATEMQTEREHADLLDIRNLPDYQVWKAMPPGPAKSALLMRIKLEAEEMEKGYPKYWKEDKVPRRTISQSSSWVGDINYEPRTNTAYIQMGDKVYTYPGVSPEGMARLLNSPSIGKRLNELKPYTGGDF